ncbi:hydrolase [Vibrio phage TCU-VP03-AIR1]
MKGYVFVNRYCKGIQAGIQGAHALLRLARKAENPVFNKWLNDHETICVLSASGHDHLEEIEKTIREMNVVEDITFFQEEGLHHSLTGVAFIGDDTLMKVQAEMKEWRELRKIGEGPKRRDFDSDMFYKYGRTYELAKYLEGFHSHHG